MSRTLLLFALLIALVVGLSLIYTVTVRPTSAPPAQAYSGPGEASVPAVPETLNPDLEAGIEAGRRDDLEEAISRLEAVPPNDPARFLADRHLGAVLLKSGDVASARSTFDRLVARTPEDPDAYVLRSWAAYRDGDLDAAEIDALRALELVPGHWTARYKVALYRTARNDVIAGISSYYRAIRRDPEGRGISTAFTELQALAGEHPDLAAAQYSLAYLANRVEDGDLERESLERYLELDPNGPAAGRAQERLDAMRAETP